MFTIIGGDGREYGPATAEQIRSWMAAGRANLDTKAKAAGSDEWRPLGDYPEFMPAEAAPPVISAAAPDQELADRWSRLGAWLLDNVLAFVFVLPGALLVGTSVLVEILTGKMQAVDTISSRMMGGMALMLVGGLILLIVQAWLLTTRGQTVGKLVLGLRIVRVEDGGNPGFVRAVLLRYFVPELITAVLNLLPPLGFFFFLVDTGFIFRGDRRCVHDFFAGTRVVRAEAAPQT